MLKDPDFRKNLIVSIVTSILVLIFIEPLLKLCASGIMWLGENISASFTKSLYTSAALGFREKYSFIGLMFIVSALAGLTSGITSAELSRHANNKDDSTNTNRKRLIFSIITTIIFFVSAISVMATNFIELQLNASFNQRLTVLAAKVPDEKIRELKASWALMEGRSDYEEVTAKMNNIAKAEKLKLPTALWD